MRQVLSTVVVALLATACATPVGDPTDAPDKSELADDLGDGKADSSIDWCARWDWYDDGECDQFCLKPDPDCQSAPLGGDPQGVATRYPIVLVHGFMGSRTSPLWSFYKLADTLRADGHVVIEADLPPFDSSANRARILATQIDAAIAGYGKVNIIAHSQGGLDARYLISSLGYGDRVATLTTISSPHQGTAIADKALGLLPGDRRHLQPRAPHAGHRRRRRQRPRGAGRAVGGQRRRVQRRQPRRRARVLSVVGGRQLADRHRERGRSRAV
ncbi:MAG: alpha/beta fold hydrolase [Proteobacteria bacterium]|nr:alpha/beta fold hydrolase [Pseudomonadota bacterium]